MMNERELRYMRMYGKYLGIVFVMLERQSEAIGIIILLAVLVILIGISYFVGVAMLLIHLSRLESVLRISDLLGLWVFGTGFMMLFISFFTLAFIAGFANEIYKAYQSARSDYARK